MIINFGSINIDHVYRVREMPRPGETLLADSYEKFLGGKGINQSVAIGKSGGEVLHVGFVGFNEQWALDEIRKTGLDLTGIQRADCETGHAVICVDESGENQIVIAPGANHAFSVESIEDALKDGNPKTDWVLLQNETNLLQEIVSTAKKHGFRVAYSAAPFLPETAVSLLEQVDLIVVNEGEAAALAGAIGVEVYDIPVPKLLITKGTQGSVFVEGGVALEHSAFDVEAVDTTGAGDTFLGSFLAKYSDGESVKTAMQFASAASALQVTRKGAAPAIPTETEVLEFLKEHTGS